MRMNAPQRTAVIGSVNNGVVGAPSTAARIRRIRDGRHRTAGDGNRLQFSVGKKSDRYTVRRPEWKQRSIRAGKFFGQIGIESLNPDRISLFRTVGAERH